MTRSRKSKRRSKSPFLQQRTAIQIRFKLDQSAKSGSNIRTIDDVSYIYQFAKNEVKTILPLFTTSSFDNVNQATLFFQSVKDAMLFQNLIRRINFHEVDIHSVLWATCARSPSMNKIVSQFWCMVQEGTDDIIKKDVKCKGFAYALPPELPQCSINSHSPTHQQQTHLLPQSHAHTKNIGEETPIMGPTTPTKRKVLQPRSSVLSNDQPIMSPTPVTRNIVTSTGHIVPCETLGLRQEILPLKFVPYKIVRQSYGRNEHYIPEYPIQLSKSEETVDENINGIFTLHVYAKGEVRMEKLNGEETVIRDYGAQTRDGRAITVWDLNDANDEKIISGMLIVVEGYTKKVQKLYRVLIVSSPPLRTYPKQMFRKDGFATIDSTSIDRAVECLVSKQSRKLSEYRRIECITLYKQSYAKFMLTCTEEDHWNMLKDLKVGEAFRIAPIKLCPVYVYPGPTPTSNDVPLQACVRRNSVIEIFTETYRNIKIAASFRTTDPELLATVASFLKPSP